MEFNLNQILESTILLEGRKEDVIRKYGEENIDLINKLSQEDPSGNNKYLGWMTKAALGKLEVVEDILNADGLLIGTTENLASMAGATKDFFDRTYYDLIEKKAGLPTAIWIRAGHDGTGTLMQFNSIIKGLRWKLVQDILICKGNWNEKFIDQCTELSLGLAIGLETNIY